MKSTPPTAYILLLDDEEELLLTIKEHMEAAGHHVTAVSNVMRAKEAMANGQFDLAVLDVCLPDGNGLDLLQKFKIQAPDMGVILITGYAEMDTATQALRYGADDFFSKPCAIDDILQAVDVVLKKKGNRHALEQQVQVQYAHDVASVLVGKSKEMKRLQGSVPQLAQANAHIFIAGERGTGKTLLATLLHGFSPQSKHDLLRYDAKQMTTLFDQVSCQNKLVLLENIDALSPSLQQDLYTLLQDEDMHVRIISTAEHSHMALDAGLFQLLKGMSLQLPSLTEREDDVVLLAQHFLLQWGEEKGVAYALSADAKERLRGHAWQGNVSELIAALQQALLSQQGGVIQAIDLPATMETAEAHFERQHSIDIAQYETFDLKKSLERIETKVLRAALERFDWNQFHTAKFLQMNRTTLIEKMKKRDLKRQEKGKT